MANRRVVTGTDASGKAVIASNEEIEPVTVSLMPGLEFGLAWGADDTVTLPTDGASANAPAYFPPERGFRFAFVTIPPEPRSERPEGDSPGIPASQTSEAMGEVEDKLPGLIAHIEPDHPGMHTTDTIDFDVVLSGEIWLELDDGAEVKLETGDCVVQNGTRHSWHNRASEPCILAVALVGARRT
ncbi:MAG: cupin domain-containing protein [Actinobacteria bacterium]|nr:cupin domain-containing protein [Actinomycetota bacterium]